MGQILDRAVIGPVEFADPVARVACCHSPTLFLRPISILVMTILSMLILDHGCFPTVKGSPNAVVGKQSSTAAIDSSPKGLEFVACR